MIKFFFKNTKNQSHYREVARGEIFMEQELRFGPVFKNIVDGENGIE